MNKRATFKSRLRRSSHSGQLVAISEITDVADRVRSQTRPHLRTEVKTGFAAIRAMLDDNDRTLLILRVDRAMSWNDVARVMLEEGEDDSDDAVGRAAARLRKRFQSVKETIRARAVETGLIGYWRSGSDAQHKAVRALVLCQKRKSKADDRGPSSSM